MFSCSLIAGAILLFSEKDIVMLPKEDLVHIQLEATQMTINGLVVEGISPSEVQAAISTCGQEGTEDE